MKFLTKACFGLLLAASAMSTPAFAQEEAAEEAEEASGPVTLSGGISVTSDYRFRGISLSNEKVAVQPTLTVSHDSGLYVGAWGSSLPDSDAYGKFELDLYGGYATEIAPGTTVDVGVTWYTYPGSHDGGAPTDYFEAIGKLSHDIGPLSATGTVAYAWDQKSLGDDSWYFNLGLGYGIPNTPVTLNAGVGYADGSLALTAPDGNYIDWSLGASYVLGPATLSVQYVDTDIKKTGIKADDTLFDPTVVFTLGVSF
ncbi:TorF family putative porin [Sphingopyxis fribergensis]